MARVEARLIAYAPGRYLALAPHVTLELLEAPDVVVVPGGAAHAHGLLAWQGQRIPMVDLLALLAPGESGSRLVAARYALVVAYQLSAGQAPAHGAIALAALPRMEVLEEAEACALPQDGRRWPRIANACMRFDGEAVPIVDTGLLFGDITRA